MKGKIIELKTEIGRKTGSNYQDFLEWGQDKETPTQEKHLESIKL